MSKVFIVNKNHVRLFLTVVSLIVMVALYLQMNQTKAVDGAPVKEQTIHLVTGEFSSTLPNGKKLEAYRWDPGTVYVQHGQPVALHITGINGASHPFVIEGLNIKGEVTKGKETVVRFTAQEEGIYRIVCLAHPDMAHNGPMVGYIVVD